MLRKHRTGYRHFLFFFLLLLLSTCAGDEAAKKKRVQALQDLGDSLASQGELRRGLSKLLQAAKLDPDNPEINHQIAVILRNLGDYPLSLQYFQRALKLRPRFPEAQNNLGTLYLVMQKWDKAIACFRKAAEDLEYRTPQYAYNNLGIAYFNQREYDKAVESYQKALKSAPRYRLCYINLAWAHEARGDLRSAADTYKKLLAYYPGDAAAHFALAKLLLKQGQKEAAIEELKLTVKYGDKSSEAQKARVLLGGLE
ncbi:MAG: tetratricopeptide repeat protein [Deltaproteobacteria bacterium]|nr:tetratricopeptide repeat protein [Deltaproteobacteria bacterium]